MTRRDIRRDPSQLADDVETHVPSHAAYGLFDRAIILVPRDPLVGDAYLEGRSARRGRLGRSLSPAAAFRVRSAPLAGDFLTNSR